MAGSELLARKEELGELLAREEGKTLPEAIAEVARAGNIFKFFAGEALRIAGETMASVRPGVQVDITREPVGVVAVIAPWNFPFAIPAWKIAPALAYGNTVVFKPAELVPTCGWMLAEILSRCGLPAGAFNLIMGSGREVGQTLVEHPQVNAVSFTGSVPTGRRILAATAARQAKVQLEMGGKNPLVVLADADLDQAVECALQGSYFSSGQRCTASSRLIVTRGIYDQFVEKLKARLEQIVVGDARDPKTQIGPVVTDDQLKQNLDYVEIGKGEGARLVYGGERLEHEKRGYYMRPALFADVRNDMRIAREEIFGPVLVAIAYDDDDDAVRIANDSIYGLSGSVFSADPQRALRVARRIRSGTLNVNGANFFAPDSPFGGYKQSGIGREMGVQGFEEYLQTKTVAVPA